MYRTFVCVIFLALVLSALAAPPKTPAPTFVTDAAITQRVETVASNIDLFSWDPVMVIDAPLAYCWAAKTGEYERGIFITRKMYDLCTKDSYLAMALARADSEGSMLNDADAYAFSVSLALANVLKITSDPTMNAKRAGYAVEAIPHFTKQKVLETDILGLRKAVSHGYSIAECIDFYRVLDAASAQDKESFAKFLSYNPPMADRIAIVQNGDAIKGLLDKLAQDFVEVDPAPFANGAPAGYTAIEPDKIFRWRPKFAAIFVKGKTSRRGKQTQMQNGANELYIAVSKCDAPAWSYCISFSGVTHYVDRFEEPLRVFRFELYPYTEVAPKAFPDDPGLDIEIKQVGFLQGKNRIDRIDAMTAHWLFSLPQKVEKTSDPLFTTRSGEFPFSHNYRLYHNLNDGYSLNSGGLYRGASVTDETVIKRIASLENKIGIPAGTVMVTIGGHTLDSLAYFKGGQSFINISESIYHYCRSDDELAALMLDSWAALDYSRQNKIKTYQTRDWERVNLNEKQWIAVDQLIPGRLAAAGFDRGALLSLFRRLADEKDVVVQWLTEIESVTQRAQNLQ